MLFLLAPFARRPRRRLPRALAGVRSDGADAIRHLAVYNEPIDARRVAFASPSPAVANRRLTEPHLRPPRTYDQLTEKRPAGASWGVGVCSRPRGNGAQFNCGRARARAVARSDGSSCDASRTRFVRRVWVKWIRFREPHRGGPSSAAASAAAAAADADAASVGAVYDLMPPLGRRTTATVCLT
jgi:hypothetical protein